PGGATATGPTTADAHGHYQLAINVPIGSIPVEIQVTDRFGQTATASTTVVHGDVGIAWDRTLIAPIRAAQPMNVGLASRDMAMVMASIYDAVNDIDHAHAVYLTDASVPATTSPVASASAAAYNVLVGLFPDQKALFDATLAESLATVPDGPDK